MKDNGRKTEVVVVINQKGGVGKTTITYNLACDLARLGHRILLVDNDPQGNLTSTCVRPGERLESFSSDMYQKRWSKPYVVSEGKIWLQGASQNLEDYTYHDTGAVSFKEVVEAIRKKGFFDFILIDTSPTSTNLHLAALMAATHCLVPVTPSVYSVEGLRALMRKIRELAVTGASEARMLGIVVNMSTSATVHRQTLKLLGEGVLGKLLFESRLRKLVAFEEGAAKGESVSKLDPNSEASFDMERVTREFLARIKQGRS